MWGQRNIGCILFGRTYFPCGFSDDFNDFVLNRSYAYTCRRCSSIPYASTNCLRSWRTLNVKGLSRPGGDENNKHMVMKHMKFFASSGVWKRFSPTCKQKAIT